MFCVWVTFEVLVCLWTASCLFLLVFIQGSFFPFLSVCACVCVYVYSVCFNCELFICLRNFWRNCFSLGFKLYSSRENCSSFTQRPGVYLLGISLIQILCVGFSDNVNRDPETHGDWFVITDYQECWFFTSVQCLDWEWWWSLLSASGW